MKFLTFVTYDVAKAADMAQAGDKVAKIPGQKMLTTYICGGKPFDGLAPNTMVAITVREAETMEALAAAMYTYLVLGATVWSVPVLEFTPGNLAEEEKKFRK
jgi:hypothetical protein